MHLYIELNTGLTENVSSSVIKKLYELASGGTLDATSDLKGTLHTTVIGAKEKEYLEGMFSNLHITADEYSLTFEDPEFERICIANWGSNGVVTANLLAAVSNLNTTYNVFKDNTNIIKATDLIYFSRLTGSNMFSMNGCTNMTEVTLPPNVTLLNATFRNCTSLTTINGLDHVTSVINSPFSDCTSLQSLVFTNLSGECNIGTMSTSALTNIEINEGATSFICAIRNSGPTTLNVPSTVRSFSFWCKNVTTITFAQNSQLTTLPGWGGFNGCNNLTTLVNFPWDTWTTMGPYSFAECHSLLGTIKTPIGLTTIEQNALVNLKAIDKIIVDSAVTTINDKNFNWCNTNGKVIMNPTTPPTLSHSVTGEGYGSANTTGIVFYVPDASYNDYISNGGQYWTELYNNGRIKKMSELPS